ncbi:MAG TPA: restriction endonuclease subunit S [Bacteroidia bacterium]|nr:restriction endonuclease subunit S [Bacteroidia bacterium]
MEGVKEINKKAVLVPKLRFKDFSDSWKKVNLGDLGETIGGLTYSPDDVTNNGTLVLRSSNIQEDNLSFEDNVFVEVQPDDFNPVKENDILICVRNGSKNLIGKNVIIPKSIEGVAFGAFMSVYRSKNNNFIIHYLKTNSYKKQVHKNLGATINSINGSDLKKFKLNIPSLPEQEKIAAFLTAVDEKIQQLNRKKQLLEQYKKGLMQQLFSGKLSFKDENGKAYPKWEEKKLGEIAERVVRKNKEDNQNVLTISAQQGLVSQLEYFNKSVSAKDVTNYYLLLKDEFAYNKSYSAGYPMGAIKRLNRYEKGVVSTLYICFKFKDCVSLEFMEQYFENGDQNFEIEKVAQEGARNHGLLNIGVNDFFNINLKLPSKEEQKKIADFLSAIDIKINGVAAALEATTQFKKGLLQQMFV